jgi:antitoxin (DNA-binding transcriptional repressor) of toxin-antitoxin stability system
MSTEIGAYEAKTHLPALLNRVAQGEQFVIAR